MHEFSRKQVTLYFGDQPGSFMLAVHFCCVKVGYARGSRVSGGMHAHSMIKEEIGKKSSLSSGSLIYTQARAKLSLGTRFEIHSLLQKARLSLSKEAAAVPHGCCVVPFQWLLTGPLVPSSPTQGDGCDPVLHTATNHILACKQRRWSVSPQAARDKIGQVLAILKKVFPPHHDLEGFPLHGLTTFLSLLSASCITY